MTIEQIQYFVTLAENRTITDAANQLHISQAGLSKAISQLEAELGFAIVSRTRQGTKLTKKGIDFLPLAQQFISSYSQMLIGGNEINLSNKEIVRIAIANTVSFLEDNYIKLQQQGVNISLKMSELPSNEIISLIKNGQFDLGLVALNKAAKETLGNLKFKIIREGFLHIYVKPSNSIFQRNKLNFNDLHQLKFVLFEDKYNDHIFNILQSRTGPLNVIFRGGNDSVAKIAVQLDGAILARDFQMELSDNPIFKKFQPLDIPNFVNESFQFGWIYRPNYHPSTDVLKLISQ